MIRNIPVNIIYSLFIVFLFTVFIDKVVLAANCSQKHLKLRAHISTRRCGNGTVFSISVWEMVTIFYLWKFSLLLSSETEEMCQRVGSQGDMQCWCKPFIFWDWKGRSFKGIDRPFQGGVKSSLIRSLFINWRLGNFFSLILKGFHHKISKKLIDAA